MGRSRRPFWLSSAERTASCLQSTEHLRSKSSTKSSRSHLTQYLKVGQADRPSQTQLVISKRLYVNSIYKVEVKSPSLSLCVHISWTTTSIATTTSALLQLLPSYCSNLQLYQQQWQYYIIQQCCCYQVCWRRTSGLQRRRQRWRSMQPWACCAAGGRWTSSSLEPLLWSRSMWRSGPWWTRTNLDYHR